MQQLKQALYQTLHELEPYAAYRVKEAALYLTVVDENGVEVQLNGRTVWDIFPYSAVADELDEGPDAAGHHGSSSHGLPNR